MKNGRPQAKDIPDKAFLDVVDDIEKREHRWSFNSDLEDRLGFPNALIRAKARALIRRKMITGCPCGCRGDYEIAVNGRGRLTGT